MSKARSLHIGKKRNLVGPRVREARERRGLTQDQLCGKLARRHILIDRSALARIESGSRYVQDYELLALADILRVSMGWLFKREAT